MSLNRAYAENAENFTVVVDGVPDWDASSPCEGWAARDVLAHVVDTQRDFLLAREVELGAAPDLGDPARAWGVHDKAVRSALDDPAIADQEYTGVFGPTTIGETMARFYGFDLIVHRWDLAQSFGRDERFSDAELALLEQSVEGFGEHLYGEGICKPALEVTPDADRQERLLARMGRAGAQRNS